MTLSQLEAQTNLRGKVIDEATGESLPGANVIISGTTIGTVTDFDGEFIIRTDLPLPLTPSMRKVRDVIWSLFRLMQDSS